MAALASVREIFLEALEYSTPESRSDYLAAVCSTDPALRSRVEGLLAAHVAQGDLLDRAAVLSPAVDDGDSPPASLLKVDLSPGTRIGPYRILEPIGEGGMGVVYLAEQTSPVRRQVALKIIKPGMDTKQVIARFSAERQALALMNHPHIARVLDAGATEEGRPYFVMELVRGEPITQYADRARLTIEERLDLFVPVCQAVLHAHQKGIIHRDLKPSNILVTRQEDVPVPKIIDFGIAKATGGALTDDTLHTAAFQFLGSPLHMSPEQLEHAGADIDTRSDIYSLGVVLFELLTGETPLEKDTVREAPVDVICRLVRDQEAPRPSVRIAGSQNLASIAASRRTEPKRLEAALQGDLDWIVLKALEPDRARRYESASALAADIERHRTNRPVEACPPSPWYRFRKYTRRNRAAITTGALVATALIAGTALSTWQALRAQRAEREVRTALRQAIEREKESKQVLDYVIRDIFGAALPDAAHSQTTSVLDLVDAANQSISQRFADHPLVEASLRMTLGDAFGESGQDLEAFRQFQRAADLRRDVLGEEHPDTLASQHELVYWLSYVGRLEEAIALGRKILEARRRRLGPDNADTLFSQARLALVMQKEPEQLDQADHIATDAYQRALRALGTSHHVTYLCLAVIGVVQEGQGKIELSHATRIETFQGFQRVLGPLHRETLWAQWAVYKFAIRQNRITAETQRAVLDSLDRFSKVYGVDHIWTQSVMRRANIIFRVNLDLEGLRDLSERWIRAILAAPGDTNAGYRHQRSVFLAYLALTLSTLPETIPYNKALALEAAQQAAALNDQWDDVYAVLALAHLRAGQTEKAREALQLGMSRPKFPNGECFDWLVEAIGFAREGNLAAARAAFDRTESWDKDGELWYSELWLLHEEASTLLGIPVRPRGTDLPRQMR